jgi:hypothetical protein
MVQLIEYNILWKKVLYLINNYKKWELYDLNNKYIYLIKKKNYKNNYKNIIINIIIIIF